MLFRSADSASYSAFVVAPFPAGFSAFGEADFTAPFAVERLAPFVTPVVPAGFGAAAFAAFGVALFFAADLAVRFAGASTAVPPAATRAAFFARRDLRRAAAFLWIAPLLAARSRALEAFDTALFASPGLVPVITATAAATRLQIGRAHV